MGTLVLNNNQKRKQAHNINTSNTTNTTGNKMAENKQRVPITLRDLFWQDPFFSSNWHDFHKIHDDMMQETRSIWQKFDERMKKFEETGLTPQPMTSNPMTVMSPEITQMTPGWVFPKKLMRLPSIFNEETSKDMLKVSDLLYKTSLKIETFYLVKNYRYLV